MTSQRNLLKMSDIVYNVRYFVEKWHDLVQENDGLHMLSNVSRMSSSMKANAVIKNVKLWFRKRKMSNSSCRSVLYVGVLLQIQGFLRMQHDVYVCWMGWQVSARRLEVKGPDACALSVMYTWSLPLCVARLCHCKGQFLLTIVPSSSKEKWFQPASCIGGWIDRQVSCLTYLWYSHISCWKCLPHYIETISCYHEPLQGYGIPLQSIVPRSAWHKPWCDSSSLYVTTDLL